MMNEKSASKNAHNIGFLGMPEEVILTLGKSIEGDALSAFDKAECDAYIRDINAMFVTSFVPPGASLIEPPKSKRYLRKHPIAPGSLVPAALKYYSTTLPQQKLKGIKERMIFAAIGVLEPTRPDKFPSILMEYAGPQVAGEPATYEAVERHCVEMCLRVGDLRRSDGFRASGKPKIHVIGQALPNDGRWGCVLVAGVYAKRRNA